MQRPLNTAMGWKLPGWLLVYGPVAFVMLEGLATIRFSTRHLTNTHPWQLMLSLMVILGALSIRHAWPRISLATTLLVALTVGFGPLTMLPVLLALFTVAEYNPRRMALACGATAVICLIGMDLLHDPVLEPPQVISLVLAVALPVAAGLYIRTRADYVLGLTERAARLERERELLADHAVAEERVRIARELHDVVAHNVSLMVVQAQAMAATGAEPEHDVALGLVADLGREALSEMHRMLGVLRLGDPADSLAERTPQPGVRDLATLIARTRDAGLEAELVVHGPARELPAGVDLSAYRIVQEALTNVIRHAGARHAEVMLAYGSDAIEVTVSDDGSGPLSAESSDSLDGHGLVGMRERVALFGGRLQAGSGDGGTGFRVHASLPLS